MTGKKQNDSTWQNTTVVLRSDIYRQALVRGIDISDACNRALAGLTGTVYQRQSPEEVPQPVIIARTESSLPGLGEPGKSLAHPLNPVINADDPSAPARVVQAKAHPVKKAPAGHTPPVPAPVPIPPEEKPIPAPAVTAKTAAARKGPAAAPKKRARGDALKTFFSSKVTRTDDAEDRVGKDELYEIFVRFCRDHRITPVPEKKAVTVALKNQFALTEKPVGGKSCWTGVRLK